MLAVEIKNNFVVLFVNVRFWVEFCAPKLVT